MSPSAGTRRTNVRAALFTAPLVVLGVLGTAVAPAGATPYTPHASHTPHHPAKSLTCRGEGVDRDALIRYRTSTVIDAPLSTIWKIQTDVERWPSWQAPVATIERLDHGPFRAGSAFRWTTPVPQTPTTPATTLEITSTVEQLKRKSCIRWTGPAIGEGLRIDRGVHVWNFTEVRGGVRVSTEETHVGEQIESNVPLATEILGQGLEGWLSELKVTAEARAHG
ncbi:SRPBCC family protein [Streptomyces niveus]|uniref:Polyketide cyclase /reductase n=1 Tax=Streptomyces niveus TaxID=193462 RepID=A0A1U9QTH4_STRNV|nr:SRPBCC family protein [Streptomyces niveus]AQU67477.1 polyketide cyclase /reductase [Streptomyces niveus]